MVRNLAVHPTWQIGALRLFVVTLCLSTTMAILAEPLPCSHACPPVDRACEPVTALSLLDQEPGFRGWLRRKIAREADLARYGLCFDDCWQRCDPHKPVVILLHGFNSTPQQNAAIMMPIRAAGFACGTFAYPNDQPIAMSAQLLSAELRRFGRQHPDRGVALVCHSMGGLVARACIEDSRFDPGNVVRLIQIAPPTHGTLLAHLAAGTDLWEHVLSRRSGSPRQRFRDSVIDGLGEAADDLCPDSGFLHELNSRPLDSHVRYSVLLGTGATLNEAQVAWIRQCACEQFGRLPGSERAVKKLDEILADIDELVEGKGDGVVAVKRGRLDGVNDTLIMPFGHIAVTGEPNSEVLRDLQSAIVARLR